MYICIYSVYIYIYSLHIYNVLVACLQLLLGHLQLLCAHLYLICAHLQLLCSHLQRTTGSFIQRMPTLCILTMYAYFTRPLSFHSSLIPLSLTRRELRVYNCECRSMLWNCFCWLNPPLLPPFTVTIKLSLNYLESYNSTS